MNLYIAGYRENNFPPLPSKCPCKPCFFHDITIDIPIQYQRTCKLLFYRWQGRAGHDQNMNCFLLLLSLLEICY